VATVREPFAIIASPVAKNASPGTAPVAAIVSPKGPPFASRSSDSCKPLHLPGRSGPGSGADTLARPTVDCTLELEDAPQAGSRSPERR
jgi:hypothetical protein